MSYSIDGALYAVFDGLELNPSDEIVQLIPGGIESGETIECATTIVQKSADGSVVTGLWRCEPCDWAPMEMGDRAEFFQVLEGSMELREAGGEPVLAGPGMSVFTPPGWVGTWRVPSRLKKTFITFYPTVTTTNG